MSRTEATEKCEGRRGQKNECLEKVSGMRQTGQKNSVVATRPVKKQQHLQSQLFPQAKTGRE